MDYVDIQVLSFPLHHWQNLIDMTFLRSAIAGDTSYVGAKLEDIQQHLSEWRAGTEETIDELYLLRLQVTEQSDRIELYEKIIEFIDLIADELEKFLVDFDRLIRELPLSVESRHPKLVKRLARHSKLLESVCLDFKNEHINKTLKDESIRYLIDRIYKHARSQMLDFRDLFNLEDQLKTFVGTKSPGETLSVEDVDVFELKPNAFGVGLNLNHIIKRATKMWRERASRNPRN